MSVGKRALAVLAAGALAVPVFASSASAAHIDVRTTENACPAAQNDENRFTDVDDDDTFVDEINCIAAYDVTTGSSSPTTYSPLQEVQRQQMALFIYRIGLKAGVDLSDTSDAGFTDIGTQTQGAKDAINALANADIIQGKTATTFQPAVPVQRDQMATFIAELQRATDLDPTFYTTTEDFFTDDETSVHESNINAIASEGVTAGRTSDTEYSPFTNVNRQQMAAFLARKIDILVEEGIGTFASPFVPTIQDAFLATDVATNSAEATPTASAGDVYVLEFDEAVNATDSATATDQSGVLITVEDAEGDTATIECDADPAVTTDTVAANCSLNEDGTILTVELLEDPVSAEGETLEYPLTVTDIQNLVDEDGNEASVDESEDVEIDDEEPATA